MKDRTLTILLGIIAANLTIQTLKDAGLFPITYAQEDIQRVQLCGPSLPDANFSTIFCSSVTASGEVRVYPRRQ